MPFDWVSGSVEGDALERLFSQRYTLVQRRREGKFQPAITTLVRDSAQLSARTGARPAYLGQLPLLIFASGFADDTRQVEVAASPALPRRR